MTSVRPGKGKTLSAERARLASQPSAARISTDGLHGTVERLIGDRLQAARELGFTEGHRAAVEDSAGLLNRAAEALDALREEAAESLARTSAQLGLAIASHLVRAEIDAGRYEVEAIVREVLAASGIGRGSCVVHLSPEDVERLADVSFRAGTEIEADIEVPSGDVHVTTPHGLLVREMDRALHDIGERILGEIK